MQLHGYDHSEHSLEAWAAALGLELDDQQRSILDGEIRRGILNCCRQWGKSSMVALMAAHFAYTHPRSTTLVVAPSARQSENLLAIASRMLRDLGINTEGSQARMTLPNRSRILALPNQPTNIRGYSPDLIVVDEAAFLPEEMWETLFPMLNAKKDGGRLWLLSTPGQPVGFFYRTWQEAGEEWRRLMVPATECPRISAAMIAEGRRTLEPAQFAREYLCQFAQPPTAAFPEALVQACLDASLPEYFTSTVHRLPAAPFRARAHAYLGLDLGKNQDPSAIAIAEFMAEPTGTIDPATRAALFRCSIALRHLESPKLGTEYLAVAARALSIAAHPRVMGHSTLVVDAGGPGMPVVEGLQRAKVIPVVPVMITSGEQVGESKGSFTVPKSVLMDRLDYLLRTKKIRIAPGPLTQALVREFSLLERTVRDSGNVTYSSPSGAHDDLVMATALAVWRAWEMHAVYLEKDGPVAIVGNPGMAEVVMMNPLFRPNPGGRGPGWRW